MMKHLMMVVVGLTLVSSPAFAATKAARHCVDKDNKEVSLTGVAGKTPAAQCKTAGGKWVKMKAAGATTTKTK